MKTVRMPPPGTKPPSDEPSPAALLAKSKPEVAPSSRLPMYTPVMPGAFPRRSESGQPPAPRGTSLPGLPLAAAPLPPLLGASLSPAAEPAARLRSPGSLPPILAEAGLPPPIVGDGRATGLPPPAAPAPPLADVLKPAPPPDNPSISKPTAPPRVTLRGVTRPAAAAHPLAAPLYWAASDLLALASQIGLGATPPSAAEFRQTLAEHFAAMEERARAAGVTPEDIRDAEYPLIAFFDELLLHLPWSGQTDWRKTPLQLLHYNENAAGETFFRRVHVLLGQPHRAHVLTIYFFAMALGFQGRYAVGGPGQIDALYDTVGAACGQAVPAGDPIGPHASRPDAGRNFLERQAPIVRASVACFGVALVLFAILRVVLSAQASRAERTMDDYTRGSGMGAP